MRLVITSLPSAVRLLKYKPQKDHPHWMVSIGDVGDRVPPLERLQPTEARTLRLTFSDVNRRYWYGGAFLEPPTHGDVAKIIDFADQVKAHLREEQWKTWSTKTVPVLLVHCAMGISRSTGTALVILARLMGPGRELEACQIVKDARRQAAPNGLLVTLGDQMLGREGALLHAAGKTFERCGGG